MLILAEEVLVLVIETAYSSNVSPDSNPESADSNIEMADSSTGFIIVS